jgi:origin recognition complex subunit 1
VIKKQLEFTPLGTRVLPPSALNSPFQIARNQLHVSSVPAALPCREEEFSTVYSHLEAAITDGSGSCIYISGTPGTGKTATVREVVQQLHASVQAEELDDFIFVEINGMKVTDPHQAYSLLWQALRGDRVSPSHALELLEKEFSTPSPRRVPCVVLMDELDQLVTKNQSVMYNFFNWPGLRHSRLIVLAVANTMDLPERTLSNKISSRLGTYQHIHPVATPHQCCHAMSHTSSFLPPCPYPSYARSLLNDLPIHIALQLGHLVLRTLSDTWLARLTCGVPRFDTHHVSGLHARPINANYSIPP